LVKNPSTSKKTVTIIGAIITAVVAAVVGELTTGFMQKDFSDLKEFKSIIKRLRAKIRMSC